ncbi:MAG: hypothetical protein V7K50_04835 [Nostoc sp.]|uniref:hypothetical protein n=1 Tax=Nostoc sp. TaxID=1180 RepID=UPI002FFBC03C
MPRLTFPPNFIGTPGSDTLIGEQLNASPAIGIDILTGGFIYTRSGIDTIAGTGNGGNGSTDGDGAIGGTGGTGTGIANSGTLNTGDEKDAIAGTGNGGKGGKGGDVGDVGNGGKGGDGGTGTGIVNSGKLNTGDGNDTISGTGKGGDGGDGGYVNNTDYATGGGGGNGGNGGTGTGIVNSGKLNTGDGEDAISGTGNGGNGGIGGGRASDKYIPLLGTNGNGGTGTGIANSGELNTGNGNDTITGMGNGGKTSDGGFVGYGGAAIGIQNLKDATITTGTGKDTITGNGNSSGANATTYGIFNNGVIDTGKDADTLIGQATATSEGVGYDDGLAYGIYGEGIIKTGDGNDKIIATSILDGVQQKVSIGGGINIALGSGNDYFQGFGVATVDGGDGFDTLDLRAFNRSELIVSGVISGNTLNSANISFNNNGNSISLSTTGFDKFIFADNSFSYSTLTNGA